MGQLGERAEGLDEAGDEVGLEGNGIIVPRVEGVPGDGDPFFDERMGPFCQEGGFAVTGGGANED